MARIRIINGKGDWGATPPTGADDHDLQSLGNDFVGAGGVVGIDSGEALVTEIGSPDMKVKVAKGTIWVENASWEPGTYEPAFYVVDRDSADANEEYDISSNASGDTRYDLVCQKVDKITNPDDTASNVCPIVIIEGTPGDDTISVPDNHELLAVIEVPDGTSAITDDLITDWRRKVFIQAAATNAPIVELVYASSITIDWQYGKYNKYFVEITGNPTISFSHMPVGQAVFLWIKQGSGGNHNPTLPTVITDDNDAIEFSDTAGSIDCVAFILLPTGDISATLVSQNQS